MPHEPRQQHGQPERQRDGERHGFCPDLEDDRGPREHRKRQQRRQRRGPEARAHAEYQGKCAVAPTAVLIELIQLSEWIEPREQRTESEQHQAMARVERATRRRPGGVRRERTEPPHVDDPIHTRYRFEAKRRNGIQDREHETDRVRDTESGGKRKREQLAGDEQRVAVVQQIARERRRRIQVSDVAFVLIEHAVDRERAAVQEHDPNDQGQQRVAELLAAPRSRQSNSQDVSQYRMPRHDRPLGRTHVQEVGAEITRQQAIAPPSPRIERASAGLPYHFSPSAAAAIRKPMRVRSGWTDSISLQSGATSPASPPVATTTGFCRDGHSARTRRTTPSTASAVPQSTPTRMQSSVLRPMAWVGGDSSVAGSFAVLRTSSSDAVRRPGMITPPMKRTRAPSATMQSNVVAVPKSTTMVSFLNSSAAASVLTIRSAPTVIGSSTSITIGNLDRPSTRAGFRVVAASMPSHRFCVTCGATDATIAARTSPVECPA